MTIPTPISALKVGDTFVKTDGTHRTITGLRPMMQIVWDGGYANYLAEQVVEVVEQTITLTKSELQHLLRLMDNWDDRGIRSDLRMLLAKFDAR